MKELLQHIEKLLVEHECVIIPDFGGFITYYAPARYVHEENLFLPPYRSVGFNPLLKMNDGLLIQSYMQAHEVSYPTALQMVESAVYDLREALSQDGCIQIGRLGELQLNIKGNLEFHPCNKGITSPTLYGWNTFEMKELSALHEVDNSILAQEQELQIPARKPNTLVININRTWLNHAVAIAAAVLLFFFMSTPVENTYVEPESYASIGNANWFEQIRTQSLATTIIDAAQPQPAQPKKQVQTPKKIHEEKIRLVNPAPSKQVRQTPTPTAKPTKQPQAATPAALQKANTASVATPPATGKRYHIIVASVNSRADADQVVKEFAAKGHPGASIIERDGRVRVALMSGSDKDALNTQLVQLRKNELFKNAWILTTRP